MGSTFMKGLELVQLAERYGWANAGPGANHPYILKKPGCRSVPVRDKIQNRFEAIGILKQLGIPKAAWPENLR